VEPSKGTVKSFLSDEWLPSARATLKPSTAKLYETLIDAYVIPRLGATRLQALTPARLNAFYAELLTTGRAHGKGGLSPTSVRNVHRVIHRALRDAVRWDRLSKNPAEFADPPRAPRPTMDVWNAKQVGQFLTTAAEDASMWILLATTGLRRAEALGLRWDDVDQEGARVTIRAALSYVGTRAVLTEPKTSSCRRIVSLPAVTVSALRGHRARQAAVRLEMGPEYQDDGFVFAGPDGAPLKPTTVSRRFERLVEKSGLPRITLHGLRHSWATIALGAGVPAKVASEILGHSSIAVTMDT
jgi:integrase